MAGLSHKDDYLETPDCLINNIEYETGLKFNFDLCGSIQNAKTPAFFSEQDNYLERELNKKMVAFCNPPRSKNGLFVNKVFDDWQKYNINIVMLLCWNDLGNKYGDKIFKKILQRKIKAVNLGKIKFCKDKQLTPFVSRLTYFYAWFKKDPYGRN
jgi:hypothetical protein